MIKVAVLGAGINGVTCALKIKEKYKHIDVVIISDEFSPNTTGDGSGGLWYPYLCGNTPEHLLTTWGGETYRYIHQLWLEGGHDVSVMPMYSLYRTKQVSCRPEWADQVFGYRELNVKNLEYLRGLYSVEYVAGHTFTTFVVRPPKIISYLYQQFLALGGRVLPASVRSLQDGLLEEYQVIINCTGLGARQMVPDEKVFPIRGQIDKVLAPWITATILDQDSGHYIIPNSEAVVLGGTHQEDDYSTEPNAHDAEFISNGCRNMIPSLQNAKLVNTWVGLRPGRDEVRLESEAKDGKLYIHNYGHGGSGLTLFWGCGNHVLQLLQDNLYKLKQTSSLSKL